MKRSPLKRKTPLRKVSPKRAAENRKYAKVREVYLENYPRCQICGIRSSEELHHLCSGGNKAGTLTNTDTILALCHECHGRIQGSDMREQAAVKVQQVIHAINRGRGRDDKAITLEDLT